MSHLLAVCALVLEDGGSEDEAIGALLHDVVEDTATSLDDVRREFGDRVAAIVAGCGEPLPKSEPWRRRKEAHLAHLAGADASVVRVALADKLHNARSTRRDGPDVWARFNAPKAEQAWWYGSLLELFRARSTSPMVDELAAEVGALFGA